ncbi:MAG: helix-turn-helix domain-containing protein [Planctomycetes bacterium]|nr:helix-turn-helix domain-containing protein [Planctomycetota bacterium]
MTRTRDLTLRELARVTGRHPETLRRLACVGRLPGAYQIGNRWAISRAAANELRRVPWPEGEEGHS